MGKPTIKTVEGDVLIVGKRKAQSGSWAHEFTIGRSKYSLFTDEEFCPFRPGDKLRFSYQARKLRSGSRSRYFAIQADTIELLDADRGESEDGGYVYVLSNKTMPGLVKIGHTLKTPSERARELSHATGVPTPFVVETAVYIRGNPELVERAVHAEFSKARKGKEFFKIGVAGAEDAIKKKYQEIYPGEFVDQSSGIEQRNTEFEADRELALARMRKEQDRREYEASPEFKWETGGYLFVTYRDFDRVPEKAVIDHWGSITRVDDDRPFLKRMFVAEDMPDWIQAQIIGYRNCWSKGKMPWRVIVTGFRRGERLDWTTGDASIGDLPTLDKALNLATRLSSKLGIDNHRITLEIATELIIEPTLSDDDVVEEKHGRHFVRRDTLDGIRCLGFPASGDA